MTKKIMIILLMLLLLVGCKTETNNKEAKKNETKTEAKVDKKVDKKEKKENSKYKFRDEEMVVKGFFSNVYIAFPRFDPEFDEGGSIESKGTGEVIYYHDTYILFDEAQTHMIYNNYGYLQYKFRRNKRTRRYLSGNGRSIF